MFLPTTVKSLVLRRSRILWGVALVFLGGALCASLLTFHPLDPSLNTSIDGDVRNAFGFVGSIVSDLFLQLVGISSLLMGFFFIYAGVRYVIEENFRYAWYRAPALLSGVFLFSIGLSGFPAPQNWPLYTKLGGAFGEVLFKGIHAYVVLLGQSAMLQLPELLTGALFILLSVPFLLFGASLKTESLGHAAVKVASIIIWPIRRTPVAGLTNRLPLHKLRKSLVPQKTSTKETIEDDVPFEPTHVTPNEPAPIDEHRVDEIGHQERPQPKAKSTIPSAPTFELSSGLEYEGPGLDLLSAAPAVKTQQYSQSQLDEKAARLAEVLDDFGVKGEITSVKPGPVVTLYELVPAPGTKSSRVIGLADDIARSMSAISARVSVIPGRNAIGVELPNEKRETVYLHELLGDGTFGDNGTSLGLTLGKDISGRPIVADLARMPHLLVAGTTGSGKSVAVNTMILSLLYKLSPEQCKLIMIDPKMLELSVYDGIPHLLSPVVTDPNKAVVALKWVVREMENRYKNMAQLGVRNIDGYNSRMEEVRESGESFMRRVQTGFDPETGKATYEEQEMDTKAMPYIVVIVDEMADLMMVAGKDIEAAIQRLAQMARAAGIHIIMATQRPSVDVITGTIKANFPTRISFQVTSRIDSRTILGESGAEQLLGQGDMLYMASGGRTLRVHGGFVSDKEVEKVVRHLKDQGVPAYMDDITKDEEETGSVGSEGSSGDELYDKALELVARERKASTSFIQRHLQIGYNRAARIIDEMEAQGVVGKANHVGKREIMLPEAKEY